MTTQTIANPWIAYRKPRAGARLRLFCFHYAGGGASVFRGWQDDLPREVEVCPVQLPGRESRLRDPAFTRIDPILDAMGEALEPYLDMPFAFFGHSMGSILSHELAVRRRQEGRSEPEHLLLSARRAPHRPEKDAPIHDLPEEEFKKELRGLNGTPEAVLEHPELMELLSPLLRADFAVCETHKRVTEMVLDCPISALGGVGDDKVEREDLEAWRRYTRGPFKVRMFEGDHFYLHGPARAQLLRAVAEDLLPTLSRLGGGFA